MAHNNAAYEALDGLLGGTGVGIVANIIFAAAQGNINAGFNPLTGQLVAVFAGIFFGIGLIHGRGKDQKEHGSES
jgi:hypothetical protein